MNSHCESLAYETEDEAELPLLRQPKAGYDLTLRVVALEQVVPHEHYHGRRVAHLMTRLVAEGRLINPPIVAQQGEKYVVLDGATRVTALRQLGYSCIIVQVVNLDQQQVQLTSWNHAVYGGSDSELLKVLRAVIGLRLTPVVNGDAMHETLPDGALGFLRTRSDASFRLETQLDATPVDVDWLHVFNAMVAAYGQWGNVERTLNGDMESLASHFPDLAALITFPRFTPQTIFALAEQGRTVPAGITRFVIPGRVLRLNAPLEKLAAPESLAAKQAWLDDLIHVKLRERQVRYYEEPVVLLDE